MSSKYFSKYQKWVLAVLFLTFILVGVFSSDDYGIAWDEPNQMEIGAFSTEYLLGSSDTLKTYHDRHYGAAYEMPLYILQKAIGFKKYSQIYNFRHLVNHFIFIISLVFFFALLYKIFQDFSAAILGVIMLYIHPRIFAHSFFNSKDIIFMSFFIIGLYTLFLLFEKQSRKRIIIHAIASAFLIDIRIIGLLLPFISLLTFIPIIFGAKSERIQALKTISLYSFLLILFIYTFWPALWTDPLLIGKSLLRMSHFPFHYDILFQGEMIAATQIPWNYIPIWISITTPPFILLLSTIGFIWIMVNYFKGPNRFFSSKKNWFIIVLITFPIDFSILLIILNSSLYDGWRQLFFLYPMILIAAIYGYTKIINKLHFKNIGKGVVNGFIIVFILLTVLKVYKLHPFEQVYFNHLVSKNNENRRKSFEMDYWGLSFRKGLEYIVDNDSSSIIYIYFSNAAGPQNILYLTPENQKRIIVVDHIDKADYFITNYRYHPEEYKYKDEVYHIERDKNTVLSIFKID